MINWSKYKFESKGCTSDCEGWERKVVPDTSKFCARFPKFQRYPEDSQDSFVSLSIHKILLFLRIPRDFCGWILWILSASLPTPRAVNGFYTHLLLYTPKFHRFSNRMKISHYMVSNYYYGHKYTLPHCPSQGAPGCTGGGGAPGCKPKGNDVNNVTPTEFTKTLATIPTPVNFWEPHSIFCKPQSISNLAAVQPG